MNLEQALVQPTEISVKTRKKLWQGKVQRAFIWAKSMLLEMNTTENETIYLVFYQNSFIYGGPLHKPCSDSFISKIRKEGLILSAHHPLLSACIGKATFVLPHKKSVLATLVKHHLPEEAAYIITTLDNFFEKEELISLIEQLFSQYRQDGKFFKAYRIIQCLTRFAPDSQSIHDRSRALEFYEFDSLYQQNAPLDQLLQKDSLYTEYLCFKYRNQSYYRNILFTYYEEQSEDLKLLLLWLEKADAPFKEEIHHYTELARPYINGAAWLYLLAQVHAHPFQQIPEAQSVIHELISKQKNELAALLLLADLNDLPPHFQKLLRELWKKLKPKFILAHIDQLTPILNDLVNDQDKSELEQMFHTLALDLLKEYDFSKVYKKLQPLQKSFPHSLILKKIVKMHELVEDPDQMMELGEYYAEFHQYDEAIDCFFWEMELHPEATAPVSHLIKMYQHKGMVKEATTYQLILDQLKNNKKSG